MTKLAQVAAPGIRGFVEVFEPGRIHGWAWNPAAPDARVRVELREGDAVLAGLAADQARPDLARNGVGDGAHAFTFTPDEGVDTARLAVVAIGPDGSAVPLSPPPATDAGAEARRALDSLVASQRVLHRNLQAVLLAVKARDPADAVLEGITATQAALQARIGELEGFVLRLDAQLARLAPEPGATPAQGHAGLLALGAAIAVAACGFGAVALRLFG